MDEIKTDCQNSKACSGYKLELEKCEKRVTAAAKTEEDCTQELFDFITCADHCVSTFYINCKFFRYDCIIISLLLLTLNCCF